VSGVNGLQVQTYSVSWVCASMTKIVAKPVLIVMSATKGSRP